MNFEYNKMNTKDKVIQILTDNGITLEADLIDVLSDQIVDAMATENAFKLKDYVFEEERFNKGHSCPVCNQFVKLYKNPISGGTAYCLIQLYKQAKGDTFKYFHVDEIPVPNRVGGSWAKLRYWGLIDEMPKRNDETDSHKKSSGYWRITNTGIQFVERKISLPKYIKLYNKQFYGFDGDATDIQDALGNKFDYNELMLR